MFDHRQFIDGVAIVLEPEGVTVATHYTTHSPVDAARLEALLIDAAMRLQASLAVPVAVVYEEVENVS